MLHFRIFKNNQVIDLPKELHSQQFIFKRAIVVKNKSDTTDYKGGLTVNLDFLSGGLEIMSNVSDNELMIPFINAAEVADIRFDMNLSAEDISRSFKTSVQYYNRSGPPVFDFNGVAGELKYIDMFFQFNSLFNYNTF